MENTEKHCEQNEECLTGVFNPQKLRKKSILITYFELLIKLKDKQIEEKNQKIKQLENTLEQNNRSLKEVLCLIEYSEHRLTDSINASEVFSNSSKKL